MKAAAKKEWSITEVFVLAMVSAGVRTQYELQVKGRMSSGAAWAALQKLAAAGLITAVQRERAKSYRATAGSNRILEQQWFRFATQRPTDIESTVRIAWMAYYVGQRDVAAGYLMAAGDQRRKLAAKERRLGDKAAEAFMIEPVDTHVSMRTAITASALEAEAEILERLGVLFAPAAETMKRGKRRARKSLPSAIVKVK